VKEVGHSKDAYISIIVAGDSHSTFR